MDGCSGKRAADEFIMSGKRSGLLLRDNANNKDTTVPICSRVGCSARINPVKGARVGSSDRAKSARPSSRFSSHGKQIVGSSSKSKNSLPSTTTYKQVSSQQEKELSETSSVNDEPEVLRGLREAKSETGNSSSSNTGTRKSIYQRSGSSNQDGYIGPSGSLSCKTNQVGRPNLSRQGLNGLRCNSISDVVRSSCSSSLSSGSGSKLMAKKRNTDKDNSSDKGKKVSVPRMEGRTQNCNRGISISDTRRPKISSNNGDNGVASVSSWRSSNSCRTRNSDQGNRNNSSPVATSEVTQPGIPTYLDAPVSTELATSPRSSYSRPGSSNGQLRNIMPGSPPELGIGRSLLNRDSYRRYNIDGIAEVHSLEQNLDYLKVLLALERIEQDEELSYEHLLVLESNLFLNGLNFYDQHRDMRLDIDNMSYEDLLALEERMGTVSTALSEEALSKCLNTSAYQPTDVEENTIFEDKDDIKCSICQEEYVTGDEIGGMLCEHKYHLTCILEWLRMKNWCPICKASAETPAEVSSPLSHK